MRNDGYHENTNYKSLMVKKKTLQENEQFYNGLEEKETKIIIIIKNNKIKNYFCILYKKGGAKYKMGVEKETISFIFTLV